MMRKTIAGTLLTLGLLFTTTMAQAATKTLIRVRSNSQVTTGRLDLTLCSPATCGLPMANKVVCPVVDIGQSAQVKTTCSTPFKPDGGSLSIEVTSTGAGGGVGQICFTPVFAFGLGQTTFSCVNGLGGQIDAKLGPGKW